MALALAGRRVPKATPRYELAQRYAPVVRLVDQTEPCGHGEPFEPIDVDPVLGNPEVALRGPWDTTNVVKVAPDRRRPRARPLRLPPRLPGRRARPRLRLREWSQRLRRATSPRDVRAGRRPSRRQPGRLALQYWFFYVYNDCNDKHEGDWEMIQLDFPAATAAEALASRPTEVGYSQHEGGERADWGADKLQIVGGTHPVVYPALGSHANYYSVEPLPRPQRRTGRRLRRHHRARRASCGRRSILVPTAKAAYLAAFPWLGYEGGWGEEHTAVLRRPDRPEHEDAVDGADHLGERAWRDSAFAIPAGDSLGTLATGLLLRRGRGGVDRADEARRQPDGRC